MDISHPFNLDNLAKLYKSFRPHYPKEVYEGIIAYYKEHQNSYCLALDVGCGTGLSTVPLAQYFDKVIGLDNSPTQLAEADRTKTNVSYWKGNAEDLSFCASESVDLVTCMMTYHWIDNKEEFYEEVRRVLKPNGVLAMCVYWVGFIDLGEKELTQAIQEYVIDVLINGRHIQEKCHLIPKMYEDSFKLPFRDCCMRTDIQMKKQLTLAQLYGYFCSSGSYQIYRKNNPDSTVLEEKIAKVHAIVGENLPVEDVVIPVSWPLSLIMARK